VISELDVFLRFHWATDCHRQPSGDWPVGAAYYEFDHKASIPKNRILLDFRGFYSRAEKDSGLQRCRVFGSEAGDTTILRNIGNSSLVNTQKTLQHLHTSSGPHQPPSRVEDFSRVQLTSHFYQQCDRFLS